jgi:hypothetical protein
MPWHFIDLSMHVKIDFIFTIHFVNGNENPPHRQMGVSMEMKINLNFIIHQSMGMKINLNLIIHLSMGMKITSSS